MKHYYRLLVLAIIVVTKFASSQIACAETLLRIATPGALTGALPIYLGGKKGVFSKYGLAVEPTLISSLQGRQAEKLGLTVIPVPLEYIWGINLTRRSYVSKNREMVKNYLRGLSDSVRLIMADKASTIAVKQQVLKMEDADSLEYAYKAMRADARPDLFPTEEAILNVLRTMSYEDPAFLSIPPYKFFDLSLIQELKAEAR